MKHRTFLVEVRIIDAPSPDMDEWKTVTNLTEEIDSETILSDCQDLTGRLKWAVKGYLSASDTRAGRGRALAAHPTS